MVNHLAVGESRLFEYQLLEADNYETKTPEKNESACNSH